MSFGAADVALCGGFKKNMGPALPQRGARRLAKGGLGLRCRCPGRALALTYGDSQPMGYFNQWGARLLATVRNRGA